MKALVLFCAVSAAAAQLFSEPAPIAAIPDNIKSIICSDFDGNPYQDILVNSFDGNLILILNGPGGFSAPDTLPWPGSNPRTADFNGDGLQDIATGAGGPLLFSQGGGNFVQTAYSIHGNGVPADFDGNGMPDLLGSAGRNFYLQLNQNWGESFTSMLIDSIPDWPMSSCRGFFTGDIAGDSFTDFGVIHHWGIRIYVAQGGCSSFTLAESEDDLYTSLMGTPQYAQCDVNGDGHPDLLHSGTDMYPSPPAPIYVSIWKDDPGLWYWTLQCIEANNYPNVYGCDFNGDGYDEVLYSNNAQVTVLEGTPSGTGTILFQDASCTACAAGFGHLSGSPNPDLICWSGDTLFWYQNTLTSVETRETAIPELKVTLSENPFSAQVTVTSPAEAFFTVHDLQGRLVGNGEGSSYTFIPEGLPAGSYLLSAEAGSSLEKLTLVYLPD